MVRARKPGAVSGPGRMSERTDLTPAGSQQSRGQPVRVASGQPYGDRAASVASQQAAPMAAGGSSAQGSPAAASPPGAGVPPGLLGGAFGPTTRPDEDPGTMPPSSPAMDDPDLLLRAMYQRFPHPDLERLLLRRMV